MQFLPAFVALEKGFYKREGLDAELISVRNAVTAVQALLGNQIHFIFSVGPQMPSIWEGSDIILLAQHVGRPTFSMVVTPDIQKVTDLKGKKIGVSFGGSTFAGTKALLELYKMNPEKDVQYVSIPGSQPKIAAMQQGIIQAALLAPPSDYIAIKAGFKRLVNLADLFKDTSFSGLAATGKTIRENPQFVKRMVRAIVRGVIIRRDYPEDAIQTMIKHWRMERDAVGGRLQFSKGSAESRAHRERRRAHGAMASRCFERETKTAGARIYGLELRQGSHGRIRKRNEELMLEKIITRCSIAYQCIDRHGGRNS